MSEKNLVNVNEEARKEMESIIWSAASETENKENKEIEKIEETEGKEIENNETENKETENKETENEIVNENVIIEDKKENEVEIQPENEVNIQSENNEVNESGADVKPEAEKKTRNVVKYGDKDWATKIPEAEMFNENTIVCFRPGDADKIGRFTGYGKKEGIIWVNMFKKDSTEYMTRQWAVQIKECAIVEDKGTLNSEYVKEGDIYFTKADFEAKEAKKAKLLKANQNQAKLEVATQ